jgi:hypothetical protein
MIENIGMRGNNIHEILENIEMNTITPEFMALLAMVFTKGAFIDADKTFVWHLCFHCMETVRYVFQEGFDASWFICVIVIAKHDPIVGFLDQWKKFIYMAHLRSFSRFDEKIHKGARKFGGI